LADNVAITAGSGTNVATDDIGGVQYQRVKVSHGADGSATDVSSASPLEVTAYGQRDSAGLLIHRPYGPVRVSTEDRTLFLDTHDQALDTTNRWNAGTGTNAPSTSGSVLTFGTTTTVSIYGKLTSRPSFAPLIPGFLQVSFAINVNTAAGTERTNGHRFWGVGTSPGTPATTSASTKLTDAIGFEIDTDGKMYAVVTAAGVRTATDLSSTGTGAAQSKQPLDGAYHRYLIQIRTDRIYWFIDSLDTPVATVSFVTPTTQTLPVLIQSINPGASVAAGGYPLLVQGTVVADTAQNHTQIGDGTYQWRKLEVTDLGAARVSPSPQTTGGLSIYRLLSAATTNAANVKASAGQLYGWYVSNTNAAARFLKIYNTASAPTAGSGTPVMTIAIPGGSTAGAGSNVEFTNGIAFSSGIGITVTGAVGDTDTTAIAANEVILNLLYK
jgi:hypothetical protein